MISDNNTVTSVEDNAVSFVLYQAMKVLQMLNGAELQVAGKVRRCSGTWLLVYDIHWFQGLVGWW